MGPGGPLSIFSEYFSKQNVKINPLSLASSDAVPKDCAALVIVAPQYDLDDRETAILEKYWSAGGRLLVLLDPRAQTPHLDGFLSSKGDHSSRRSCSPHGPDRPAPADAGHRPNRHRGIQDKNAVTRRLIGSQIVFPGDTQSLDLDMKGATKAQINLRPLVQASELYWGETDYVTTPEKGVRYDEGRDVGYPVYIAASADRGGTADDRVQIETSKLIAVGTSEFALDAAMSRQSAGLDFLVSSMNWLLDRSQLTGILPKNIKHFSLEISESQMSMIALIDMIGIPAVAAIIGFLVWLRRRA